MAENMVVGRIVGIVETRGRIFVATETGVWQKEIHADVFHPVPFEVKDENDG